MSDYTISDMISSAARSSPSEFQTAFNNLMLDRIAAAVDQKKIEFAQHYFSQDDDSEEANDNTEEDTTEDNEENTDEDTETDNGNEEEREA